MKDIQNLKIILINYFKMCNKDKFIDKIHTTNNICECINFKFSYYLLKENMNNLNFLKQYNTNYH